MKIEDIILELYRIGAIKFGKFHLKSGISSPIYIDLRLSVSYPNLLKAIVESMWKKIQDLHFDFVCGVPYTAIPFATCISFNNNIPMLMRRKEVKKHGTKKFIEGDYSRGGSCLIVEDLITSGSSILETAQALEGAGLSVRDAVVLVDREQGGETFLNSRKYCVHAVSTLSEVLHLLYKRDKIDKKILENSFSFIREHQILEEVHVS